jgi:Aerotolerance regulator N-terminal/von Willebrand factor type A domain
MPTFLNPALFWGLSLAAIPIIIHLFNRRRYRRLEWAAMDFLLAALKKNQRRLRIENLLLLLVRTLLLLLLALAICRPFFADSKALAAIQRGRTSLVIVIDNSYSMGMKTGLTTPFERAIDQASALIDSLAREDTVSVVVTSDNVLKHDLVPRAVLQESADLDKARRLLTRLKVSPLPSQLASSLRATREVLAQPAENRRLVIITDLQAAFWEGASDTGDDVDLTARDFLEQIHDQFIPIAVIDVGAGAPRNVAVTSLESTRRQAIVAGAESSWIVKISNHSPAPAQVELTLHMDGRKMESRSVNLEAASGPKKPGEKEEPFSLVFATPGNHSLVASITPDTLPIDDERTTAVRVRERIRVLAVDGDPDPREGQRPETFLIKNALEVRRSGPIQVDVIDVLALPSTDLDLYDLIVLANVDRVREESVGRLERYVDAGNALVFFLGDRVDPDLTNQAFLKTEDGLLPGRLGSNEIRPRDDPIRMEFTATDHPILATIADPRQDAWFEPPLVNAYTRVTPIDSPTVRVLATYDDLKRFPAILERTRGEGRVILFTTSADDGWVDYGSGFLYVALLHEMVYDLTWTPPSSFNRKVGQALELGLPEGAESISVARPRGIPIRLDPIAEEGRIRVVLRDTEDPGLYTLTYRLPGDDPLARDERTATEALFAFGLDPHEADTARLSASRLTSRLSGLDVLVTRDIDEVLARPTEARQGEVWRLLLFIVLGLLILESLMARRFGDYARREDR